jgi:ferredoxin/flavodoxin
MQKILIHVFSGTGNTYHAAVKLAEFLGNDADVTIYQIENKEVVAPEQYDLNIFMFPIYATAVPAIMYRYMRKLKKNQSKAVMISTNGRISHSFRDGYQGWALHEARWLLALKGYKVFFSETLDYPHNITCGIPALSEAACTEIIVRADTRLAECAEAIKSGTNFQRRFFYPHIIWSMFFGLLYSCIGRIFFGRLFVADNKCTHCGFCAKACPAGAIKVTAKTVFWNWKCEGCLRCFNICPQKAIQISAVKMILMIMAIFINPLYSLIPLFKDIYHSLQLPAAGRLGQGILAVFLYFLFILILDIILTQLCRVRFFRSIISFGHTRFLARYFQKSLLKSLKQQHFSN